MGVTLVGRFLGAAGSEARFAADLADSVAWGDARFREIKREVLRVAAERGLPRPEIAEPAPFPGSAPSEFRSTVRGRRVRRGLPAQLPVVAALTDAFDDLGFPIQVEGASTVVDGLYFVGTHFLRTRKSSTLLGVGDDAAVVARAIAGRTISA